MDIKSEPNYIFVNSMVLGTNKRKAVGYITSRPPPLGLVIVLVVAFLALFSIMSIYFAIISSGNPAAIMMVLFFAVPLLFILGIETNAFPDLPKRKWKSVALFYITALFIIPIIGTLFVTINVAIILMLIIFSVPLLIAIGHLATSEGGWEAFGENSKEKLSHAGEKIKSPVVRVRQKIRNRKKEPKRRLKRKW